MNEPQDDRYAAERAELAAAIHKKVNSSSISRSVPYLLGDADRAVTAVVEAGWRPPVTAEEFGRAVEHMSVWSGLSKGVAQTFVEVVLESAGMQIASAETKPLAH